MSRAAQDPRAVLAALERYPPLGGRLERIAAVGGFVRDVWLGREPRELDLVVEGDAVAVARSLGGALTVHEAFGTAAVSGPGWSIDLASARRERYPRPGALPIVEPASLEDDLRRRDFTVNAIAVTVEENPRVLAVESAQTDLEAARLRVLHEASFVDDPTRALRLARYAERLRFEIEPQTARLAAAARLDTVSGARIGAELRLAVAEPDPIAVLARVAGQLPIEVDRDVLEGALALAPADADRAMLVLGTVARGDGWLDGLELTAREHAVALACAHVSTPVAVEPPSALWRAWHTTPVEAVAVAGARSNSAAARDWIERLRFVALEIGGDDLIAAGLVQGPEIGRRLERTLARKLDGELAGGREAELAEALAEEP